MTPCHAGWEPGVYDIHMLNERLQILVSTEQRRRLEAESKRTQASVASLIRQAIDAQFGAYLDNFTITQNQ